MNVRAFFCAILLALSVSVGLAASGAAADGWPPWKDISRGGGMSVPGGRSAAAFVIPNRETLDRFPLLTMHPPHPPCSAPCEWYERFDWKHDAVLLVVARMRGEFDLHGLARRGSILRVTIGRFPGQPASPTPFTFWIAVDVRTRLLGLQLPRKVAVIATFPAPGSHRE